MTSMKINHKILSIPPYISTTWNNISSLTTEEQTDSLTLHIALADGSSVSIPNINHDLVDAIFRSHVKYLEEESSSPNNNYAQASPASFLFDAVKDPSPFVFDIPLPLGGFKTLTSILQHDPEKKEAPELPKNIVNKITSITKTIGNIDIEALPKAEPHCNCPHCQIARSMRIAFEAPNEELEEEEVPAEELSFKSWIIHPPENKIYKVIHPDNPQEEYSVFLGSPVSCTCGSNQCEHILAVLKS